jgi:O-antigen/teichoic acid export membrane protein
MATRRVPLSDLFTSLRARSIGLLAYLRLKPFGDASPEDRAKERYRRVALTMVVTAGTRAVSILTLLITVPLTVNYLGSERYGMWATISSFLFILAFADLGIGNGLLNAIAESHGRGDREAARGYVSSAFVLLSGIALLLGIGFALLYAHVPWERVFNVSSPQAVKEAGPATAVFAASFLISIPLSIVQRVQRGYQEGYLDSLWVALGKVLGLGAVLVAIALKGGLAWLVLALVGGPALALALNNVVLFGVQRPWLRPRWSHVRRPYARRVMHIGWLFFVLNLAGAVAFYADPLVLAQVLGPDSVTEYNVVGQLFRFSPMLLSLFLDPLWPAYGEALARGDVSWLTRTFRRSVVIGLALNVPYALALVLFGSPLVHLWVGDSVTPTIWLLIAFGVWTALNSFNGSIAMLLNGANVIRFQVVCAIGMAIGNLILSILLTREIGVSGVIWGSVISQSAFVLFPSMFYIVRLFSRLAPAGEQAA